MRIEGCLSAIPTPFNAKNEIDENALATHALWMVENGCSGVVVCGTTGESATMSPDEKIRAIQVVSEALAGKGIVIGGAGNNSTSESLEFVERVNREVRVDAIMSVVPYYTKPPQAGIKAHFNAIADASKAPVVIYNVPSRSVVSMTVRTMLDLMDHPNIVSCKEASGDIHVAAKLVSELDGRGTLLSGDDGTSGAFVAIGGHGVISVASNIAPRIMSDLIDAAAKGDRAAVAHHNKIVSRLQDMLFSFSSPVPTKVIMEHLGFCSSRVRLPLVGMEQKDAELLCLQIDQMGIER